MCCGRATSCPEPSGCTSGPPRPGQQRRGEGRWASAFHCCCLDGWGRGGPAAAPGSPITGQGWWESQTQRSLHPAFGIPEVSLLGPLASPGASPASLCPGGQGARVHLPGTHACPASPPQGPSPQGVCPPPLPAPGGGGCPVAAGSHLSRCTRGWAPALPALEAPQGQGPPLQRLTSSSGGGREYGAWRVPGPLTSALCAGGGHRAPGRGGLRPEHPGRQRAGRRQLPVPPAQQA